MNDSEYDIHDGISIGLEGPPFMHIKICDGVGRGGLKVVLGK